MFATTLLGAPGVSMDFTRGSVQDWPIAGRMLPVNIGLITFPFTVAMGVRPLIVAVILCTTCSAHTIHKCLLDLGTAYQRLTGRM